MERLFIDESGSMTVTYCSIHPYFVVAIVRAKDPDKLKRVYKRFIKKYMSDLKKADRRGSMFRGDDFIELKGNCFTSELKKAFVEYFCKNEYFEVFYIVAENRKIKGHIYDNTARAFNYFIKLALEYYIRHGYIQKSGIDIQLDERNERTETKHFLENYLNTELLLAGIIEDECKVSYFDSSNNIIIQVADVFANLLYSELRTGAYAEQFERMKTEGYVKHIFKFPL